MPPKNGSKTNPVKQPFIGINEIPAERVLMKQYINEACSHTLEWYLVPEEEQTGYVTRMERDCFNKVIEGCIRDGIDRLWTNSTFRERYSAECYKLLANLDLNSSVNVEFNGNLVEQLIEGAIDAGTMASMSSIELCPEASRAEREMIALRRKQVVQKKVSHNYICKKCGGNETELSERQLRAADEAATIFKTCVNCGFRWI